MDTINDVLAAVSKTLRTRFEMDVYRQPTEQGFVTPCFFVRADDIREQRMIAGRILRSFRVTVEYVSPEQGQRREDALAVSETLFRMFDLVQTPDAAYRCHEKKSDLSAIARGYSRGFEVTDELLRFSFVIKYFTVDDEDEEADAGMMERLIIKEEKE